jgi:hypothetical protein
MTSDRSTTNQRPEDRPTIPLGFRPDDVDFGTLRPDTEIDSTPPMPQTAAEPRRSLLPWIAGFVVLGTLGALAFAAGLS